jgi:hypothetical protein
MIEQRRFRQAFWGIVAVAGLWRVLYVLVSKDADPLVGDQIYYSAQASTIANGEWFADPFRPGTYAADHAPLTALSLAPVSWSDTNPVMLQRILTALYGIAVVVGVGALARWLFDRRIALIATALAGAYANLWMNDALLMSETLAAAGVVGILLAAYMYDEGRRSNQALALGVILGIAGLARAELLLLGPMLVLPMTVFGRRDAQISSSRRIGHLAIAGAAAVLVVSPWVIRNQIRFEEPTTISTQDGLLLLGTNCEPAYEGDGRGFWLLSCMDLVDVPDGADQSEASSAYRSYALDYLSDHADQLPGVVAARLGRGLSIWQTEAMSFLNEGEGRERWASQIGLWQFWLLTPLAAIGLWRWPSQQARWPLVVTGSLAIIMIAAFYGIPRFRIPAEIGIVVCAAVALDQGWRRATRKID